MEGTVNAPASETFLVTGSEGCLGAWVVKNLVDEGHACIALDLSTECLRIRELIGDESLERVVLVEGDIASEGLVRSVVEEHGVTRVVHLAALQIPLVAADPVRGAIVNVAGAVEVFEAVRAASEQVRGLVYASSAAVFGPVGSERRPETLYGVFKVTNEECARVYFRNHGTASFGLRPWAIFGFGRDQGLTSAPTQAMKAAVLGVPFRIPFGGRLNLQYADDVARTFVRAALAEPNGASVHNLRGAVVTVDEVVAVIEELRPEARGLLTAGGEALPFEAELPADDLAAAIGPEPYTEFHRAVAETLSLFERLRDEGKLTPADLNPA
jgi:UDP-glucuronate 4-epimerase